MLSIIRRHLSTRSKDAGRITGRLQSIWIESNGMTEDIKVTSDVCFSNPYLTLVKDNFNCKENLKDIETQPKVCELNRRIELLRKQPPK